MKVGAHDISAIRQGMIAALDDAMRIVGVGSREAVPAVNKLAIGISAIAPLLSDESPTITIMLPLEYECVNPLACGGGNTDGEKRASYFDVTGAIYHRVHEHKYAFCCSRNRDSSMTDKRSGMMHGAVFIHEGGERRKVFVYDEQGNITATRKGRR